MSNQMKIPNKLPTFYLDVTDTIALPPIGYSKFGMNEVKLKEIVSKDIKDTDERNLFIKTCERSLELFINRRRDSTIPIGRRYFLWLKPFIGLLRNKHFNKLVKSWTFNEKMITPTSLIRRSFNLPSDHKIEFIVESGNVTNIVHAFLNRKDIAKKLKENNINIRVDGVELILDKNKVFQGKMKVHGNLFVADSNEYPEDCLVVGDNAMEKYGFGNILLNIQTYDSDEIEKRIKLKIQQLNRV